MNYFAVLIMSLVFSLAANAAPALSESSKWQAVSCADGFNFEIRKLNARVDGWLIDQVKLATGEILLPVDDGADSDLVFESLDQRVVLSLSILSGADGRVVADSIVHERCSATPNIADLRCKFLGICP